MSEPDRIDRAAELLERLVTDPGFRSRFRGDPAAACREHGLWDLAGELAIGGKAMHTLELRESKSSLAGVISAVAAEGIALHELLERVGPALQGDAAAAVNRALTLGELERVESPPPGAGTEPGAASPGPEPAAAGLDDSTPAASEPPVASEPPATPPPEQDAPEPGRPDTSAAGRDEEHDHSPVSHAASAAPAEPQTAGAQAVLENPRIELPPAARADIEAGVVDPRLVAILSRLSKKHELGLSVIKTGHGQFTSSGSVSNHFHGRGLDIASVDGSPVSPANVGARELAEELASLTDPLRASEIGTPFPIGAPGFFTDGAHLDHIHLAFDDPAPAGLELPAGEASNEGDISGEGERTDEPEGPAAFAPAAPRGESARQTVEFLRAADAAAGDAGSAGGALEIAGGDLGYPGDDAPKEELAGWMAAHAQKAGLPPELPVMAALVESNLQNVTYGDRDSLGFFQMRTSIWDQGEYAGYAERPELQMKWFIDHALAVKQQRGLSGDDADAFGEWIADVERPATEYRGRYQLRLAEARRLLRATKPEPGSAPPLEVASASDQAGEAGAAKAHRAVQIAKRYLGTPYLWGGASPETGFDCSGLVQYAYGEVGVETPRVAEDQHDVGERIESVDALREGDLVFFADASGYIHHVGIYLSDHRFLHAPQTGDVVKISSLDEAHYKDQFAGGSRLVKGAPAAAEPTPRALTEQAGERDDSLVFRALARQEGSWHRNTVQFLKAIDPETARRAAAGADPASLPASAPAADKLGGDYPGDDASRAEIARWMARHAEQVGLPGELPVMLSLVETNLQNLAHGDRDSLGFFQMRTSVWDRGEYAGYPERPGLQLKWFLDQALDVKRSRVAAGDADFGRDPDTWGEWVVAVGRPAAQYEHRYQPRLREARELLR